MGYPGSLIANRGDENIGNAAMCKKCEYLGMTPKWPDHAAYLNGAPPNSAGTGPDRSKADFLWCKKAIERGFTVEQVTAQLLKESTKAQERKYGEDYARQTAESAAAAVAREGGFHR